MDRRTVQLRVGGQTYRVVTSASDAEMKRLLAVVEQKLSEVTPPGRAPAPNALLLVAISLVHDLEEERARTRRVEGRARDLLQRVLERIDAVLVDDEPSPAPPPVLPSP
jgi:cell division protein ZapA